MDVLNATGKKSSSLEIRIESYPRHTPTTPHRSHRANLTTATGTACAPPQFQGAPVPAVADHRRGISRAQQNGMNRLSGGVSNGGESVLEFDIRIIV